MYAELKCKSNFSFLRGASDAREYIQRAGELLIPAVAITDVNGVYGLPRAFEVARNFPELKLITGCELRIKDHTPITLLARDRGAYAIMCRLLTTAHFGKDKGEGMITFPELIDGLEDPRSSGLICFPEMSIKTNFDILKQLFADRLSFPVCKYLDGMDEKRLTFAMEQSKRYETKLFATNDPHYHIPDRRKLQDCLTCIREETTYRKAGFKLFGNDERYLKSPLQMLSLFRDMPSAIKTTLEIAETCTFKLSELSYTYPKELTPPGYTPQAYFEELVLEGAHKRYRGLIPSKVDDQIQHEFRVIKKLDYASYFLTIADIVRFSRSKGILCQGRGSAANSICCYALGITAIDAVKHELLFERFISEKRAEPPDIDIDFEHERREEIIQFIYEQYGRDRAAMVSAVRTYRERSSFLEISKAVGVEVGTISAKELERDFVKYAKADVDKLPLIQKIMEEVADFPRHLSIHSGGFTLSHDPIIETVPIEPARMEKRTICQWDKNDLDTTGLIKVDILSIGFLTVMNKACNLLNIDWYDIPDDDEPTYEMIRRADTDGTFQIESRAQKSMLPRTQPQTFYDLVVELALVRPGPNVGQMVHPYLKGRAEERAGRKWIHPDPIMQSIVGRTYGVPIFQEQVMKLAYLKAGFDDGEVDQLRRSLSAFRSSENVDTMSEKLYHGLIANGMSVPETQQMFLHMKGFAHYGFPESHSASYAMITYKSCYLKCHHPAEFFCAIINSQPFGFYSVDYLTQSYRRNGVVVLPIHPNISMWDATMEKGSVRMGFRDVVKIREEDVKVLIQERDQRPFSDLLDFVQRSRLPRTVIENMALAGLFECFGLSRRDTFWSTVDFQSLFDRSMTEQLPLFAELDRAVKTPQTKFRAMSLFDEILADHEAFGYSLHGNIMKAIRLEKIPLPMIGRFHFC
jgi:error-prone DNA polymerase